MTWLDEFVAESESGAELPERVRESLWGRGVTDEQISQFQIGYVDRVLPAINYPQDFVSWSGDGGKLDDCYVLPITNTIGEIRGLQFRHVDRERGGYMDFILAQDEAVGFGLAQAMPTVWETGEILLVEGGFDLLPLQRFLPGIASTLTARVTEGFVRILRRLVRRVWIGYDMDSAGNRAYDRFRQQYGREFDVRRVVYPRVTLVGGKLVKDPGDLWEAWGDARLGEYLRSHVRSGSLMEFPYG